MPSDSTSTGQQCAVGHERRAAAFAEAAPQSKCNVCRHRRAYLL